MFTSAGNNDLECYSPTLISRRVIDSSMSLEQPFGLCEFGHQGLPHEEEIDSGSMIQNRMRIRRGGAWYQRDPWQKNRSRPTAGDGYQDGMSLYGYLSNSPLFYNDIWGSKKLVLKYYNEGIDKIRTIDWAWEGFPSRGQSVAEWVDNAKSQVGNNIDKTGECGNCIDLIVIVAHSGLPGMASLSDREDETMVNGDFSDRNLMTKESKTEEILKQLNGYMCNGGYIEIRQCSSAFGDEGTMMLKVLGESIGSGAKGYTEDMRFGLSGFYSMKSYSSEGAISLIGSPHYTGEKKKKR